MYLVNNQPSLYSLFRYLSAKNLYLDIYQLKIYIQILISLRTLYLETNWPKNLKIKNLFKSYLLSLFESGAERFFQVFSVNFFLSIFFNITITNLVLYSAFILFFLFISFFLFLLRSMFIFVLFQNTIIRILNKINSKLLFFIDKINKIIKQLYTFGLRRLGHSSQKIAKYLF